VSEVVVPLGDYEFPKLSSQAIQVAPGESLCITGVVEESGALTELRLLSSSRNTVGPVISLTLEQGERTRLRIRHTGNRWLHYQTIALVTGQDDAARTTMLPIGPNGALIEDWDGRVQKLLLHGFRFAEPPAPPTILPIERQERDPNVLNFSVTFGFWAGERGTGFEELNQALAGDGFAPLDYSATQGGLDLDFTVGRTRLGVSLGAGGRTTEHTRTGVELSTWQSDIGFTGGFDILRYDRFHAFASTGFLVGLFYLDYAKGLTLFSDVQPEKVERVTFSAFELPIEVGTDYLVPFGRASDTERWLLQFGMRLGWVEQIGIGGWTTDDEHGRDLVGPAMDLSGPRFRLVLGFGAQNGW
jgi:hypothetical protein